MSKVVTLSVAPDPVNEDAIEMVEGVLERLRSGDAIGVGIIEVMKAGTVATAFSHNGAYHSLNSGAARLAARLANEPSDC